MAAMLSQPVVQPHAVDRLERLFDTHHQRLYRLARRLSTHSDEARDLVQETFLRAAKSPQSVPTELVAEEAWLVRVLVNLKRDEWRRVATRRRLAPLSRDPPADRGDPEKALIARAVVWRALDRLAPRRRAVLVMHELEGQTIQTIATILGVTAITVRWYLAGARRELAAVILELEK